MYSEPDLQQYALYDAERSVSLFHENPLLSPREAKNVLSRLNLERPITVVFRDIPEFDACYYAPTYEGWQEGLGGHIVMSNTGRTLCILMHELAHYLVLENHFHEHGNMTCHGEQFAWHYVKLVWETMGRHNAQVLANAFRRHGVKGAK